MIPSTLKTSKNIYAFFSLKSFEIMLKVMILVIKLIQMENHSEPKFWTIS